MKKIVKLKNNEMNEELNIEERRFGVILEDMDDKLNLIIDGHQALNKKIDNNHKEFQEFRGEVNYKFGVVFDELHLIRNELKEKVSRDEFIVLEKRVATLEKFRK